MRGKTFARYCTECAFRDCDSSGTVSYIPTFSPGRMGSTLPGPSKSWRQKIHRIEYVEYG